jgi:HTH-type transcriptional regulator/antitoxin MqsA
VQETRIHPETGETLRRGIRRERIVFGPLSQEIDVPGWYPDGDGDGIHSGEDLAEADRVFKALKKDYGERVRRLRKSLKLSQEEAGRLIGGGKRAFQKYESGAMAPSDAAVGLIEVLMRHPEAMETLREVRG